MTATRIVWISAVVSVAVVAGLAISALGLFPLGVSGSRATDQSPAPSWTGGNWTNGTYNVTFSESGLPAGTFWSVAVRGAGGFWNGGGSYLSLGSFGWGGFGWNGTTNSSLGFRLHNGTYDYSVGSVRNGSTVYSAAPSFGNLTVNGTSVSVAITFAPVTFYNVTFSESGLPAGSPWSVVLRGSGNRDPWDQCGGGFPRGGFAWNVTNTTSLNFSEPNGLYRFSVGPVWANGTLYIADPSWGNVTVNGSAASVSVTFAPVTLYTVSFVESGLPNGTNWTVGIGGWFGGFGWNRSSSPTVNFSRPDGFYGFAIGPVWNATGVFLASPHWGSVEVDGASVTVNIEFTFTTWND